MNKQIDEMAKTIDTVMLERCFHNSCVSCEFDDADTCRANMIAAALINDYGYRKASDVAREIFEEIEAIKCVGLLPSSWVKQFAELKKKYESEDNG